MIVKRIPLVLASGAFLLGMTFSVMAERTPSRSSADPRVATVTYSDREVVALRGHFGYTMQVVFAPYEKVTDLALGDSAAWAVVKSSSENSLLLKPLEANPTTNLIVNTTHRNYVFALTAAGGYNDDGSPRAVAPRDATFTVQFIYPDDEAAAIRERERLRELERQRREKAQADAAEKAGGRERNDNYEWSGSRTLRPIEVFDDGKFTYFKWPPRRRVPAIFWVDEHGNESLVNYHVADGYHVVERTAEQYTLRDGNLSACVVNRASKPAGGPRTRAIREGDRHG